ncbi:MAG: NfeD family protein [Alphaproteobacteria bacterium]|nr:NfeD family protein [Alphaproteobacteria bacterium]MDX5417300.1 NfeD family protein [Alphaproteobacteria bacterium]MDX5494749.1 NfeD family protein [Alphaproteobacteria bacterium]
MELAALFEFLDRWVWFIVAALLAIVELVVPGVLAIWLAIAAAIVGGIVLVFEPSLAVQLAMFAALSVLLVWASRQFLTRHPIRSDHPTLNQRGASYIGSTFPVEQDIHLGRGKVRVGDSVWLAEGEDAPAGTKVRVTGVNGSALVVERID